MSPRSFLALDFETADIRAESACAIGLVKVTDHRIVGREHFLIKPPSGKSGQRSKKPDFMFTYIHGITRAHVAAQPCFGELWPKVAGYFEDIDFVAAHNASFDRRVLLACCDQYGITPPKVPFLCTVQLARATWEIYPTKLPNVCEHLGIELKHHEALSDAEACARIVIHAHKKAGAPAFHMSPQ
ncbi:MAG TPA: 3'-5' exonuclease [Bdellovibrionota bacterium]|nr:3'-5' exonuclease [Bdellovibrionota bacterium]